MILCAACVRYRRAGILVKYERNATAMGEIDGCWWMGKLHEGLDVGRWTRCVPPGGNMDGGARGVDGVIAEIIERGEVERGWVAVPIEVRKLPGWSTPPKVDGGAAGQGKGGGGGPSKGGGKKKKATFGGGSGKVNAPLNSDEEDEENKKKMKKGKGIGGMVKGRSGTEACVYLPVDVEGVRVPEMGLCPLHRVDPMKLVGL